MNAGLASDDRDRFRTVRRLPRASDDKELLATTTHVGKTGMAPTEKKWRLTRRLVGYEKDNVAEAGLVTLW